MQFAVNRHSAYRVLGVLVAVAVLFVVGCDRYSDDIPTGPPIDTDGLVVQGWNHFNNGQYQDAVDSFNEASHVDAKSLEAYLGMGYAFAQLGELGRATQNFNNVLGLTQVLIDEGSITVDQAKQLRAEAHVGHASVELADRDWDNAIAYTDSALTLEADFQHRKIATLNAFQVKLLKAEACFGKTDYATCMDILDAIAPGGFIAGSIQVAERIDTLVVTLLEDTWATGIAEIELPNPNLIKPISILALDLGNEQLDNELFGLWNGGVPDDWTITNDLPGVRYVEEVDSSDVGGAIGTGGACRFYNYSGADEVLALSQDNLPATGTFTRVLLNVKAYIAGELQVLEGDNLLGSIHDSGIFFYDFTTSDNPTLTIQAMDSTNIVVNDILCHPLSSGRSQRVVSWDAGSSSFLFEANPLPAIRGSYVVDYYYAIDFGAFLIDLRTTITQLRS